MVKLGSVLANDAFLIYLVQICINAIGTIRFAALPGRCWLPSVKRYMCAIGPAERQCYESQRCLSD